MLLTASNLGYTPSTVGLMSILSQSAGRERLLKSSFKDAVTQFDRVVRTEKNPDAFTLQGLLCLQEGQPTNALRYFDKAIDAARSLPPSGAYGGPEPGTRKDPTARKPRWSLERDCHQKRGELLLQQKRTDEAMASFKIAALELNHADGYAELAKLMPADARLRSNYLIRAAQAGNFEACGLLALHFADVAARPAKRRGGRLALRGLAYEWASIEPDFKKRDELQAQVAEKTADLTRSHLRRQDPITRFRRWLWSNTP
jgi:tetratricopeptide (TPR) repeat protein